EAWAWARGGFGTLGLRPLLLAGAVVEIGDGLVNPANLGSRLLDVPIDRQRLCEWPTADQDLGHDQGLPGRFRGGRLQFLNRPARQRLVALPQAEPCAGGSRRGACDGAELAGSQAMTARVERTRRLIERGGGGLWGVLFVRRGG